LILRLRQEIVPRFLDDLVEEIDFSRYVLVGFTCLFDQTTASLALARRIKRNHPGITTAFGGYALQRPVGPALQKAFSEMDVVAYGDGEPVIAPLWEAACGARLFRDVPNITYRDGDGRIVDSSLSAAIDLDDSPTPNYDDFFRQRENLRNQDGVNIQVGEISVESSRGCWYGQKSHCTFCGIDDETLRYRVKSARRTAAQLDRLHARYNVNAFRFADYIMPLKYYQDFLPALVVRGGPYSLFYETKANLKVEQIEVAYHAGVRWMQPGIESFSSRVLKLMAKGVTAAQNVFALYHMIEKGICPLYNLIFGFPFETADDYRRMLQLLPALSHFFPPVGAGPVVIMRHAPLAETPERFGVAGSLKAHWRYGLIFSSRFRRQRGLELEDFCYCYENPYAQYEPELKALYEALQHQVMRWNERFGAGRARLTFQAEGDGIMLRDSRFGDNERMHRFGRTHRLIGEVLTEHFAPESRLIEQLARVGLAEREIRQALDELLDARVVVTIDRDCVWLAFDERSSALQSARVHEYSRSNPDVRNSDDWPEWKLDMDTNDALVPAPGLNKGVTQT
jgi:ribosomal peptide maturation radical SAM protein 1